MEKKIKVAVVEFNADYQEDDPAYYLGHISQAQHDKAKERDDAILNGTVEVEVETENDEPTVEEVEKALLNYLTANVRAGEVGSVEVEEDGFEIVND